MSSVPTNQAYTAPPTSQKKAIFPPLLTWKDPIASAKVFGGIFFTLISFKAFNLINLFFHLGYIALISAALAEYVGKFVTGTGFVTRFRPHYDSIVSQQVVKGLDGVVNSLPALEDAIERLVFAQNIENTLKAGVAFYILYKITSWISLFNLVLLSTVSAFTIPAIYETFQTEINALASQYYKIAQDKSSEYTALAKEKSAPYVSKLDQKLGPVSKFVKEKYQVRTASSSMGQANPSAFATKSSEPATATASGVSVSPEVDATKVPTSGTNPFERTEAAINSEFPNVPETTPLAQDFESKVDAVKQDGSVNVDELKKDIYNNKTAAANF